MAIIMRESETFEDDGSAQKRMCCVYTLYTTPSTTGFTLSRANLLVDLVDFLDLPVGTTFSSIDARSPGLIPVFGLDNENPK
jgi:hypothetical protein